MYDELPEEVLYELLVVLRVVLLPDEVAVERVPEVPVLLETEPDAGLLLEALPLPTTALDEDVRLVPNEALDVVAVLLPETDVPAGVLPMLALTLLDTVSWREPL